MREDDCSCKNRTDLCGPANLLLLVVVHVAHCRSTLSTNNDDLQAWQMMPQIAANASSGHGCQEFRPLRAKLLKMGPDYLAQMFRRLAASLVILSVHEVKGHDTPRNCLRRPRWHWLTSQSALFFTLTVTCCGTAGVPMLSAVRLCTTVPMFSLLE